MLTREIQCGEENDHCCEGAVYDQLAHPKSLEGNERKGMDEENEVSRT
jgi:hypothetical protein